MKCKGCRAEIDPGIKYCSNCGARQLSGSDAFVLFSMLWFVILFIVLGIAIVTSNLNALNGTLFISVVIGVLDGLVVLIIIEHYGKIEKTFDRSITRIKDPGRGS